MHNRWWKVGKEPIPNLDNIPACYFLYVLGSGGHTAEMFELLRVSVKPAFNAHRRYLFTTGDSNSLKAIAKFEKQIADSYPRNLGGTWDAYQVHRARNIHQPLYTTWFTALYSALDVYAALTTTPDNRRSDEEERKLFKYPHLVVTNGPGTGVITALVIRFLKVFFLVPQDRLKVMFIETWAHVSTLSLTGRIFHWLAIADVYLVQHQPLADKYGYQMFDFIMPYPRHPDQDANHG
jgi:beta-1,4-N-acetylglucosaminyltransferase